MRYAIRWAWAWVLLAATSAMAAGVEERVAELRGKLQKDPAGNIVAIDLENVEATAADVQLVAELPELKTLTLWGPGIDDAALERIAGHKKLASLTLKNTAIANDGLKKLHSLKALRQLNLQRSAELTDEGME